MAQPSVFCDMADANCKPRFRAQASSTCYKSFLLHSGNAMKTFSLTKFVAAFLVILGLFGSASSISATVQVSIDPNKDGENAINRGDFKSAQAIFSSALNNVGRKSAAEAYIRCGDR